jgi:hypothetical protein
MTSVEPPPEARVKPAGNVCEDAEIVTGELDVLTSVTAIGT